MNDDGKFQIVADLQIIDSSSMTRKDGRGVMYIYQVHIPQAHSVVQIFADFPVSECAGFTVGAYKGTASIRPVRKV
jgi:hypothetical protein